MMGLTTALLMQAGSVIEKDGQLYILKLKDVPHDDDAAKKMAELKRARKAAKRCSK